VYALDRDMEIVRAMNAFTKYLYNKLLDFFF